MCGRSEEGDELLLTGAASLALLKASPFLLTSLAGVQVLLIIFPPYSLTALTGVVCLSSLTPLYSPLGSDFGALSSQIGEGLFLLCWTPPTGAGLFLLCWTPPVFPAECGRGRQIESSPRRPALLAAA